MGSRKKAFAVMIPALALVASACQVEPGGNAGPRPGASSPAAGGGDLDGGGINDVDNPGDPGGGQQPPEGGGQQPGEQPPGDGEPSGQPPGDGEPTEQPPGDGEQPPGDGEPTEQPPGDGEQPPGDGEQPPGDGEQPPGDGEEVEIPELRPDQYVPIRQAPRVRQPRATRQGSTGVFNVGDCGTNEGQAHSNPDNVVAAPGVENGAHHIHDYVGNLDTDAFSTDETLAAAGTTCESGDKSTYYWPVVRDRSGQDDSERAEQSTADGNIGSIVEPTEARLEFLGNPRSQVTAMPQFLRMATGDAKAVTNGLQNAKAQWTCTGFEERAFTDKYPLCPEGSLVARVLNFASCWDGQNTDSANHRDHVSFPDERTGACPEGTQAVPQLRMTLTYDVPAEPLAFALDSFPESGHDPVTDHGDFINVMGEELMQQVVTAVNGENGTRGPRRGKGKRRGAPTEAPASPTEAPATPTEEPAAPTEEPAAPTDEPAAPTETPATPSQEPATRNQN